MAEERVSETATKYMLPHRTHTVHRPEVQGHRYKTITVLAKDHQRAKHFHWARKWSTDWTEIDCLRDPGNGASFAITGKEVIRELHSWAEKFDGKEWARQLPNKARISALAGKGSSKKEQARALAQARKLVFKFGEISVPEDPGLQAPDRIETDALLAALQHPFFSGSSIGTASAARMSCFGSDQQTGSDRSRNGADGPPGKRARVEQSSHRSADDRDGSGEDVESEDEDVVDC